jgi:hypothetical protein
MSKYSRWQRFRAGDGRKCELKNAVWRDDKMGMVLVHGSRGNSVSAISSCDSFRCTSQGRKIRVKIKTIPLPESGRRLRIVDPLGQLHRDSLSSLHQSSIGAIIRGTWRCFPKLHRAITSGRSQNPALRIKGQGVDEALMCEKT